MSHLSLQRRLRRLERVNEASSDGSGLAPHSPEWVHFWARWADLRAAGEEPKPECIPLEAFRALVALEQAESADELGDNGRQSRDIIRTSLE
jgi:hypothetical protein